MKKYKFIIYLLLLFLALRWGYHYYFSPTGFRSEMLARDYFSNEVVSIPIVLFKAHSQESVPYSAKGYAMQYYKQTVFCSIRSIDWLAQEISLGRWSMDGRKLAKEDMSINNFGDSLILSINIEDQVSPFAITKIANSKNGYLFSNMSKQFFDPENFLVYSYLELILPLQFITDERIHDNVSVCYQETDYLAAAGKEEFMAFYEDLNRYHIFAEENGFVIVEDKELGSAQTIYWPVRFIFQEKEGNTSFRIDHVSSEEIDNFHF
ncbi:MAG: hypothetical protein AAGU12_07935 [Clostridiales bacterium]